MTEPYSSFHPNLHITPLPRAQSPASFRSQDELDAAKAANKGSEDEARPTTPASISSIAAELNFNLSAEDVEPTYVPQVVRPTSKATTPSTSEDPDTRDVTEFDEPALGCEHYKRNVKLQCSSCSKWYTCRFCHDQVEDHSLVRRDTKNMLCMLCGYAQPAGEGCNNCGERSAWYYCSICKLWDDDNEKSIYHCNDCGICRVGRGLGKDFYHCNVSFPVTPQSSEPLF